MKGIKTGSNVPAKMTSEKGPHATANMRQEDIKRNYDIDNKNYSKNESNMSAA